MEQVVKLHGGPCHGREMAIPEDWDFLIIAGVDIPTASYVDETSRIEDIPVRRGRYSRVRYHRADFEWDGWDTE